MAATSDRFLTVEDYLHQPAVTADARLPYGEDVSQFGDLYLPAGQGPHPTLILIHGGCWRAQYGLSPLGSLCDALRQDSVAVWSLEYRRLGNGGGWPTTFQDVAAGIDHLYTLAEPYALDLERVIVAGHSAGGHLALWSAGRHRLPQESPLYVADPLKVRGVVALAAIPDLVAGVRWDICGGAIVELLGGAPNERPERYAQASPVELLPLGVAQWHIVGSHDAIVPPAYLQAHVAIAEKHNAVRLDILPNAAHFEVVDPQSEAWATVRGAVLQLLK
ncbi:alpha/beta hydrolase fold domain-containing protein [bacterium]|nr:alpha/beta hydrolase fold domain-containing protein [bacterium]